MKWLFIFTIFLFVIQTNSQDTYSKVIDIDKGSWRNYIRDMVLVDHGVVMQSVQFCSQDTLSYVCGSMTLFNQKGEIVKSNYNYLTAAFDDGANCLYYNDKNIFYSTNLLEDEYAYTTLFSYDSALGEEQKLSYGGPESNSNIGNEGLSAVGQSIYLYGVVHNASSIPDSVQIIEIDAGGNELNRFYYSYGSSSLEINDLQATPDGNLAFILKIKSAAGANNGFDGYQLMKIDPLGNVLDTFVFDDIGQQPNRLLCASDGSYYFCSKDHPFEGWDPLSYGMINKMNTNMGALEWSLILPNDQLVDGRHYRVWDFIEASNGDIVACGMAFDNTDTDMATGVPDRNSTWNGFIVRIAPDGDIKWLRLYRNNNDLLPHEEYGRFRPSRLNKIKELSDGRLVAAGDVFVNNRQLSSVNEQETEAFHLWLLMVDENGCLDGLPCEEIIRLGNRTTALDYHIGDQWIYETEEFIGGGALKTSYRSISVKDTVTGSDFDKYVLDPLDTFYVQNSQMFFWDEHFGEYVMYFDFDATSPYAIKYYDIFRESEQEATVIIDSITYEDVNGDSIQRQHIRIINSGIVEGEYSDIIYAGIGARTEGVRPVLGCGLCDPRVYSTRLRCFISSEEQYNFVPYACDTTFTSNISSVDDTEAQGVSIYPNPATDRIYVSDIDTGSEVEVIDLAGTSVLRSNDMEIDVSQLTAGTYFIKLVVDGVTTIERFVKM